MMKASHVAKESRSNCWESWQSWGLLATGEGPALHLSFLHFAANDHFKVFFCLKKIVDLSGRNGFKKFYAIFFLDLEAGFFHAKFVAVLTVSHIYLPNFGNVRIVDRPEFLGFLRCQV